MTLYDQTVEPQVHRLLRERGYEGAVSTNMAGITEDWHRGTTTAQFNGNGPHRRVAVEFLPITAKAAVDGSQPAHTCLVQSLQRTHPQFDVGINWILHQYGNVRTTQGICQRLHGKGISRGTRTDPQQVYAVTKTLLHMFWGGNLGGEEHSRLLLYPLQPGQRDCTLALEGAWLGARFPHTSTKNPATVGGQSSGHVHHLFLRLGGTRACYNQMGAQRTLWKLQGQ